MNHQIGTLNVGYNVHQIRFHRHETLETLSEFNDYVVQSVISSHYTVATSKSQPFTVDYISS